MRYNPFNIETYNVAKKIEKDLNNVCISNWTGITVGTINAFCCAYSSSLNLHVALGSMGTSMYTSSDGITWTEQTLSVPSTQYNDVIWCSPLSLFIAVASTKVITSPDGITWTDRGNIDSGDPENPWTTSWYRIVYATHLGLLVAVGGDGGGGAFENIMTSPDGITWTNRSTVGTKPYFLNDIAYSESLGMLVAVTDATNDTTAVLTSTNGTTWTARTAAITNPGWYNISYNTNVGLFIINSYNTGTDQVLTSPNGTTWTVRTGPNLQGGGNFNFYSDTYKKTIIVDLVSNGYCLFVSDDGITYTNKFYVNSTYQYPNKLCDNGSYIVGVGSSGKLSYSLLR